MSTETTIPNLTEAEQIDMACRVHDSVCRLRVLQADTVWNIRTFRVGDILGDLTRRQCALMKSAVGKFMGTENAELISMFEVDLPEDLQHGPKESYELQLAIDKVEVAGVDVDVKRLRFGAARIPEEWAA